VKKLIQSKFLYGNHELTRTYLKQVGTTLVIRVFSVLISLVYVPVVLGYLDKEKYGIWITLTTVVNWIQLLDVGMGNGLRNKLAESVAQNKLDQGRMYVSTTYVVLGSIFLGVLILFYFINPCLNWQGILNTSLISTMELISLTTIAVSFILLCFILQTIVLVYAAHGNSSMGSFLQLLISSFALLLIWLATLYTEKGNLIILAWIVTGVPVLIYSVFSVYTFMFKYPQLCPSWKYVNIKASGNLLRLSAQFFIVQISATIIYSSIPFVVTQLFSPNEVTVFNIANSIFNLPIMMIGLITAPILPLVTQAFSKNDINWLRNMLKKQMMIAGVFAIGTILMIVVSPFIYQIWIGDKVSIHYNLSVAIGIFAIIQVLKTPFSTFINGIGKIKIIVVFAPVEIGMFIGFSILFAKLLNDVVAVSIALSLTSTFSFVLVLLTLHKYLKNNKKEP
jgi:O-antigen/teichoic acid export membrane protein